MMIVWMAKTNDNNGTPKEHLAVGAEFLPTFADVIFGDYCPGGKLPGLFPHSAGQLPIYFNCKLTAKRGYLFPITEPLFPFGLSLSYTTFEYSNLKIRKAEN